MALVTTIRWTEARTELPDDSEYHLCKRKSGRYTEARLTKSFRGLARIRRWHGDTFYDPITHWAKPEDITTQEEA